MRGPVCEWCDAPATRCVTAVRLDDYVRFSCQAHHDKVDRLVALDLGGDEPLVVCPVGREERER